jgi:LysM repeat protein
MVQRVPAHLGEESNFSPWLVVGAVAVIIVVGGLLLFFSGLPNTGASPAAATTRTRTPRPTTVIVVTATPPPRTATLTPRPTPAMIEYVVKGGDTLIGIAQQFNVTVDQIREANNLQDDLIRPGDRLMIPTNATPGAIAAVSPGPPSPTATVTAFAFSTPTLIPTVAVNTPASGPTPTPTPGVVLYQIQEGDTLGTIAKAFSTTVESIMQINKMANTNIRAGQNITVPVGAWIPTRTPTVYIQPTATQTPQFEYAAPVPLSPADGATISGDRALTFQWTAVGVLAEDEFYVLSVSADGDDDADGSTHAYNAGKDTHFRLDASPVNSDGPVSYRWYVLVVRGSGCGPGSPAATQPCAVSPPSAARVFIWE